MLEESKRKSFVFFFGSDNSQIIHKQSWAVNVFKYFHLIKKLMYALYFHVCVSDY